MQLPSFLQTAADSQESLAVLRKRSKAVLALKAHAMDQMRTHPDRCKAIVNMNFGRYYHEVDAAVEDCLVALVSTHNDAKARKELLALRESDNYWRAMVLFQHAEREHGTSYEEQEAIEDGCRRSQRIKEAPKANYGFRKEQWKPVLEDWTPDFLMGDLSFFKT
jgi:hypothetical protein